MAVDLGSRVTRDPDETPAWDQWAESVAPWFGLQPNQLAAGPLNLFEGDLSTYGTSGQGPFGEYNPNVLGWQREGNALINRPTDMALTDLGVSEYLNNSSKTPSHEWAGHHWDTYFGKQFGTGPSYENSWMSPVEAYLADPELYEANLASDVSGYGGPYGDYELQMMKQSWDQRGPKNQLYADPVLKAKMDAKEAEMNEMFPYEGEGYAWENRPYWSDWSNEALLPMNPTYPQDSSKWFEGDGGYQGPYYKRTSAMHDALVDAFMKNPDRANLGEAQAPLANVVAHALSDYEYDRNAVGGYRDYLDEREALDQTRRIKNPHPKMIEYMNYDPYLGSAAERMGRLAGDIVPTAAPQPLLDADGMIVSEDYSNSNKEFTTPPDVVEDFRKGYGYLLDRLNPVDEHGNLINTYERKEEVDPFQALIDFLGGGTTTPTGPTWGPSPGYPGPPSDWWDI